MKCPICNSHDQVDIDLHADGFAEGIVECRTCGAIWSISHGLVEMVRDPQQNSFLERVSERVEGEDYSWLG